MIIAISGIDGSSKTSVSQPLATILKALGHTAEACKPRYFANHTMQDFCAREFGGRYAHALLAEDAHENLEPVREIASTQLIQKLRLRLLELLTANAATAETAAPMLSTWRQSAQLALEEREDVPFEAARFVALMGTQRADLEALKLTCPQSIASPRRYVRHRDPVALLNLLEALSLPEGLLLRTTLFHFSEIQRVNA